MEPGKITIRHGGWDAPFYGSKNESASQNFVYEKKKKVRESITIVEVKKTSK